MPGRLGKWFPMTSADIVGTLFGLYERGDANPRRSFQGRGTKSGFGSVDMEHDGDEIDDCFLQTDRILLASPFDLGLMAGLAIDCFCFSAERSLRDVLAVSSMTVGITVLRTGISTTGRVFESLSSSSMVVVIPVDLRADRGMRCGEILAALDVQCRLRQLDRSSVALFLNVPSTDSTSRASPHATIHHSHAFNRSETTNHISD